MPTQVREPAESRRGPPPLPTQPGVNWRPVPRIELGRREWRVRRMFRGGGVLVLGPDPSSVRLASTLGGGGWLRLGRIGRGVGVGESPFGRSRCVVCGRAEPRRRPDDARRTRAPRWVAAKRGGTARTSRAVAGGGWCSTNGWPTEAVGRRLASALGRARWKPNIAANEIKFYSALN